MALLTRQGRPGTSDQRASRTGRIVSPAVIAFEGTDGSGKSTWAAWLQSYLEKHGVSSVSLPEFDNGPIGTAIAAHVSQHGFWSLGNSPAELFAALSAIASDLVVKVSRKQTSSVIIADRHILSILECQYAPLLAAIGTDHASLDYLQAAEAIIALIPPPRITVILELDAHTRIDRLRARGDTINNVIEAVWKDRDQARQWAIKAYRDQLGAVLRIDTRDQLETETAIVASIRPLIADVLQG